MARLRALALPPLVRDTAVLTGPGGRFKRAVIAAAGGHGLRRNSALAGAYGFEAQGYGERMRDRLAELPARGGWLFCHPGDADPELHDDPIAAARIQEAVYLASPAFADDLRAAGVELITPA